MLDKAVRVCVALNGRTKAWWRHGGKKNMTKGHSQTDVTSQGQTAVWVEPHTCVGSLRLLSPIPLCQKKCFTTAVSKDKMILYFEN